jgi:outer membrane immunogenic protein
MRLHILAATALTVTIFAAGAASAQDSDANWTGFYAGGQIGYNFTPSNNKEAVSFDRNLDGNFGDAFANFAPGFCGGTPNGRTPADGCKDDKNAFTWKLHGGYDYQFEGSGIVVGGVLEAGRAYIARTVTAYSTTPAVYRMGAKLKETAGLRGRAGYAFDTGTLAFLTGGLAYGRINNSFATSNSVNTVTVRGANKDGWGYSYGGGVEQKIGKFSIGLDYLFTSLKNDDFRVRLSGGAVGGPFTVQNASGTDFRRSFSKFGYHTIATSASYRF